MIRVNSPKWYRKAMIDYDFRKGNLSLKLHIPLISLILLIAACTSGDVVDEFPTISPDASTAHARANTVAPSTTATEQPTPTLTLIPLLNESDCIVFGSDRSGEYRLHKMSADGSNTQLIPIQIKPVQIGSEPYLQYYALPALSPDGTRLVFRRSVEHHSSHLLRVNIDGSEIVELTPLKERFEGSRPDEYTDPAWSPDGAHIVYAYTPDVLMHLDFFNLYSLNTETGEVVQLTMDAIGDRFPSWSPDGERIVFSRGVQNQETNLFEFNLYTINPDGTNLTQITDTPNLSEKQPIWSPDGKKIMFSAIDLSALENGVTTSDIYVMNADSTNLTRLTYGLNDTSPTWSPDGSQIAFVSLRNEKFQIFVMNADGTDQHSITNDEFYDTSPNWGFCEESP